VSTERFNGKWVAFTPLVEIRRLRNEPKPFFIVMTAQFFRSEQESDLRDANLGKEWIDKHAYGI
jgi:hypothetical protein